MNQAQMKATNKPVDLSCDSVQDLEDSTQFLMLALGDTGGGKTTLGLTHPGKKFGYYFDPNALRTVQQLRDCPGFQLDYKGFYPDRLNLNITSLSKGKGDRPSTRHSAETYKAWEADFEARMDADFFADYDCIIIDSITTFQDLIMDRILEINGRPGEWPHQDDYGPQMNTLGKIMRTLTSLGKDLFVTGHYEMKQDEVSKRIFYTPMVTGRLRTKLPLLFSEIWKCEASPDGKGEMHWRIQVKPDRLTPLIRSTMKGFEKEVYHDVTVDFKKPLDKQGLAQIIAMQK